MQKYLHMRRQVKLYMGIQTQFDSDRTSKSRTSFKLLAQVCKNLQHHFAIRLELIFNINFCSVQITEYSPKFAPGTASQSKSLTVLSLYTTHSQQFSNLPFPLVTACNLSIC